MLQFIPLRKLKSSKRKFKIGPKTETKKTVKSLNLLLILFFFFFLFLSRY